MGYSVKEELYELLKLPLPQEQERESTESKRLMDEQRALVRSMEAMEFNQSTTLEDQAELEIRVLTKLSKSKERSGVVQLVDVFKDEDHYFLLMDQCQCSLTEVLLKKKKLSEHEAAVVIKNVARTVGKMHDMGMAHRDIKTDNRV
ncbi:calcium-dependent protein kinase 28 [Selaginella moellendorffii]|uniref:calcium-dependent protein kinase 28 n=1 Tax=Selaginella moellendorffii TaxID=88036 RepID=UPI000D1CDED0|nr:calcium-dependent protein kinase 28 [Selaginella moellendorffii]|eukprot:XP_024537015.1 calcium-dependent protein kinase 28 [Selaginella moellendorffii]